MCAISYHSLCYHNLILSSLIAIVSDRRYVRQYRITDEWGSFWNVHATFLLFRRCGFRVCSALLQENGLSAGPVRSLHSGVAVI